MSGPYLNHHLMLRYDLSLQIKLWLSPGDGFKGLPSCPTWF
jgi:hypothetical protein